MHKGATTEDAFGLGEGERVQLRGWVWNKRQHGKLIFIDLRDPRGVIQVAVKKGVADEASFKAAESVSRESSVSVEGVIKKDPRAPGGTEVSCTKLHVINNAAPDFPIKQGVGVRSLFDNRHLHIRGPKVAAIMRIRSNLIHAAHEWFRRNGFVEIHCPTFITAAVEGGATLFPVDYFDRKVYLTQSSQFYQEAAIFSLGKVYSIQPSFRAEKSRTRRHLTEYWHVEAEVAYADLNDIMKIIEDLISYMVRRVAEESGRDLKILGREINVKATEPPYERITYDEALDMLRKKGIEVKWGADFGRPEERALTADMDKPLFVVKYPREAKAFYHMPDPEDPRVTLSADLLAPKGYGEIVGSGQRIHDYDALMRRISEEGLNAEDYRWYLDLRKYGSIPHSGFGMGLERVIMWLLKLPHIRSACLFPRTPSRVWP